MPTAPTGTRDHHYNIFWTVPPLSVKLAHTCLGKQAGSCANQISIALHIAFAKPSTQHWSQLSSTTMPEVPDPAVDPIAATHCCAEEADPPTLHQFHLPHLHLTGTQQISMITSNYFCKSVDSWFTLQNVALEIPPGDPTADINSTHLEYVLNFFGQCWLQEVW